MSVGEGEQPIAVHPAGGETAPREAILVVPGVAKESADQSVEGVAMRLAAALDRNAASTRAKFRVGEVRDADFGSAAPVRVATIFREDDGAEEAVADVYHVAYGDLLLEKYRNAMPWLAILRVVLAVMPMFARLLTPRPNRAVTGREKLQIGLAFLLFMLLAVYLVILVWALVATVAQLQAFGEPLPEPATGSQEGVERLASRPWLSEIATFLALLLTALGFALPARAEVRQKLTDAATLVMALSLYFQAGERRRVLSGWLHTVLQRIQELEGIEYAKIRIIAYSFGSIVTLDTLFPDSENPGRVPDKVDSLVTIGSPFDFVQLFWPRYFEDRKPLHGLQWINIFAPEDVLSSNFRSHSKAVSARMVRPETASEAKVLGWMDPPENVKYRLRVGRDELTWWEPFLFVGLRSHSMYWEPDDAPQVNVYDVAIARLYAGQRVLR